MRGSDARRRAHARVFTCDMDMLQGVHSDHDVPLAIPANAFTHAQMCLHTTQQHPLGVHAPPKSPCSRRTRPAQLWGLRDGAGPARYANRSSYFTPFPHTIASHHLTVGLHVQVPLTTWLRIPTIQNSWPLDSPQHTGLFPTLCALRCVCG